MTCEASLCGYQRCEPACEKVSAIPEVRPTVTGKDMDYDRLEPHQAGPNKLTAIYFASQRQTYQIKPTDWRQPGINRSKQLKKDGPSNDLT